MEIRDRGPYVKDRIIGLTPKTADSAAKNPLARCGGDPESFFVFMV